MARLLSSALKRRSGDSKGAGVDSTPLKVPHSQQSPCQLASSYKQSKPSPASQGWVVAGLRGHDVIQRLLAAHGRVQPGVIGSEAQPLIQADQQTAAGLEIHERGIKSAARESTAVTGSGKSLSPRQPYAAQSSRDPPRKLSRTGAVDSSSRGMGTFGKDKRLSDAAAEGKTHRCSLKADEQRAVLEKAADPSDKEIRHCLFGAGLATAWSARLKAELLSPSQGTGYWHRPLQVSFLHSSSPFQGIHLSCFGMLIY